MVTGRADLILDQEGEVPTGLAILEYKTSARRRDAVADLQLQAYSDAGRREGLDVRGAYVHDLKVGTRTAVDVGDAALARAEEAVLAAGERMKERDFSPSPGVRCRSCEVRTVRGYAQW
jgi:DNA helicase-2/ATP-dependent DNA helicase PcrA